MEALCRTPLSPAFRMAILAGAMAAIRLHIKTGGVVNATDEKGRSPLILAASRGNVDICWLLLAEGADPALKDFQGNDALAVARSLGRSDIAVMIEEALAPKLVVDPLAHSQPVDGPADAPEMSEAVEPLGKSGELATSLPAPLIGGHSEAEPFDISGWSVEVESQAPAEDPTCVAVAYLFDTVLMHHLVVDHDEKWDDIEISLPEITARRAALSSELQDQARQLILVGLRDGRLLAEWLENGGDEFVTEEELQEGTATNNLVRVLADLGVVIDDCPLAPDAYIPPDEDDDEEYGEQASEVVAYLSQLQSGDNDPYIRYLKVLSKERLTREDEARLGEEIEKGMLEALVHATASQPVVRKLLQDAQSILQGTESPKLMFNAFSTGSGNDEGEEPEGEDAAPGMDERWSNYHLSDKTAEKLKRIALLCGALPVDRMALSATLAVSDLSRDYLKSLWIIGAEEDYSGRVGRRITAALDRAEKAKNQLVEANLRLVMWVARRYPGLAYMDRVQEGNIGLMKAAERFRHRLGVKFSTYAQWWIRQSITRAAADLGRTIRVPVHVHESWRKIERAGNKIFLKTGKETPDAIEFAAELDISTESAIRLLRIPDEPVRIEDESELEDRWLQPADEIVSAKELKTTVQALLKGLDTRPADIIRRRFGIGYDEHTLEEVGQVYGVTRERIRQIEAKTLKRLLHPIRAKHLRSFLDESTVTAASAPPRGAGLFTGHCPPEFG